MATTDPSAAPVAKPPTPVAHGLMEGALGGGYASGRAVVVVVVVVPEYG